MKTDSVYLKNSISSKKAGPIIVQAPYVSSLTAYPGQEIEVTGFSQVLQDGILVCEEEFREVASAVSPATNPAGLLTTLRHTSFSKASSNGTVEWGYDAAANPLRLAFWDPSIHTYNVTMTGRACTDYVPGNQTVQFAVSVRHLSDQELSFNATKSLCPPVSYNSTSNTAGLVGQNPAFANETGCSIVYNVTSVPYDVQFGFLQAVLPGAIGTVSSGGGTDSFQTLFESGVTADCLKDGSGVYRTITSVSSVMKGASSQLLYTNSHSVFSAPYYSKTCDISSVTPQKTDSYSYYGINFDNYLMMKVLGSGNAAWVPVRKASWSIDALKAECDSVSACGTGLNSGSYANTLWNATGNVTSPSLDVSWQAASAMPSWTKVFQNSYKVDLLKGGVGPDFWYFCPVIVCDVSVSETGKGKGTINQGGTFTVYPGELNSFSARAKCYDMNNNLKCEEDFTYSSVLIDPPVNGANLSTILQSTSFEIGNSKGKVVWGANVNGTHASFAIWDPFIDLYTVTANGNACVNVQDFSFFLKVEHPSVEFDALKSRCPESGVTFNESLNTLGVLGQNPDYPDEVGCGLTYSVSNNMSFPVTYGILQTIYWPKNIVFGGISVSMDGNPTIGAHFRSHNDLVIDCPVAMDGRCRGNKAMPEEITLQSNQTTQFHTTNTGSIFWAPYFFSQKLYYITGFEVQAGGPYINQYGNYLMMKVDGPDNYWVPVRKSNLTIEFDRQYNWNGPLLKCDKVVSYVPSESNQPCGTGTGTLEEPFVDPVTTYGGWITPPQIDSSWDSAPSMPAWVFNSHSTTTAFLGSFEESGENFYYYFHRGGGRQEVMPSLFSKEGTALDGEIFYDEERSKLVFYYEEAFPLEYDVM